MLAFVVGVFIISSAVADTAARAVRKPTHIPAQELGVALKMFADERGLQVLYFSEAVRHLKTQGATGEFTTDEALNRLLAGTGLTFQFVDGKTVTILPMERGPPAVEAASGDIEGLTLAQSTVFDDKNETLKGGVPVVDTGDNKISEVVVTAQKREERLQDVPISISVLSGQSLDHASYENVREALNTVPGVLITTNHNGSLQVSIRGVTAGAPRFAGAGTTAYYLDSIPFSLVKTAIAPDSNAYDLDRVEVLRGPQGTLYGASALNGVVRVLTRDADLNDFSAKVRAATSSTQGGGENYRADAAINVPLVDRKLAARLVAGYEDFSGWIDRPNRRDANNAQIRNVRLKLNAQPTERLALAAMAWRSRIDRGAPSAAADNGRNLAPVDEPNLDDYDAYTLKGVYELAAFSVSSMTSYLDAHVGNLLDFTPSGFPGTVQTDVNARVFAQEITVNSPMTGGWRWSLGGMYRDATDSTIQAVLPATPAFDMVDSSESVAFYGELIRSLLDGKVELTGGLRYFRDEVAMKDRLAGSTTRASDTFDAITPRIVATWKPHDGLNTYVSYSEGFRSGAEQLPPRVRQGISATHPDTLKNYEIGFKTDLWGGLMSIDAAIYYIDWVDVQQALGVPISIGGGTSFASALINAGSASGAGVDVGMTVRPFEGVTLNGSFSQNNLTYDSDVFSGGSVLFARGARAGLPKRTVGGSAEYDFSMGSNRYEGRLSASAHYSSELTMRSITDTTLYYSDPQFVTRAGFAVSTPGGWVITVFGDNLNNEHGKAIPASVPYWVTRARPRTFGMQIEAKL